MTELRKQTINEITGKVSTVNSTYTPLPSGGVFTGVSEDITNYASIFVTVATDQDSAENGLSVEQSPDGVNWDQKDVYSIFGGANKNFNINPNCKYFRIVYSNGDIAQNYFRLQVIYKQVYASPSSVRLQDTLYYDDDAQLTKSVLAVQGSHDYIYHNVDIEHPIPINNDSVYEEDVDSFVSDNGGFTGTVRDYFDSLETLNYDDSSTNPKYIKLWFKRTLYTTSIGLGCNDVTKSFSNVKLSFLGSAETVRSVADFSSNDTKYNSKLFEFAPIACNGVLIEFYTADEVAISNITIPKEVQVVSRIKAMKSSGSIIDIGATNYNNLKVSVQEYGDTASVDSFARLRVSEPYTIFDSKQLYDKQPLFWDEIVSGTATSTHVPVDADTEMTVLANSNDYVIRQTKQRFNYQPGKSQLIFFTFHAHPTDGTRIRIGLFDGTGVNYLTPNNGIFLEFDNTDISWNICKDGTITETAPSSAWNVDKLDGTGRSAITLDTHAAQIGIIDYEWLGVGRVRVGFVINGLIYYTHYFYHANVNLFESVYMSTPNLPIRYSIESYGTGSTTLSHICSTVISEGGVEHTGMVRSISNGSTPIENLSTGVTYALLGVRLKSTHLGITIIPESISEIGLTADAFRWALLFNPTISGTFTFNSLTDSSVEYAIGTTANVVTSPGYLLSSGYASQQSREVRQSLSTALRLGATIAGVRDILVLSVTPISNNLDVLGSLNFRELL